MSISTDFNLNALKDTYDYSGFLARLDEYRHFMTDSPSARHEPRAHDPLLRPRGAAPAVTLYRGCWRQRVHEENYTGLAQIVGQL